jgi:hypothetical protein
MNLFSCDNCGVVLDKDKVGFPAVYDGDFEVIDANCEWDGDGLVAIMPCPVCKETITENM